MQGDKGHTVYSVFRQGERRSAIRLDQGESLQKVLWKIDWKWLDEEGKKCAPGREKSMCNVSET